jgi:hypothetical protein
LSLCRSWVSILQQSTFRASRGWLSFIHLSYRAACFEGSPCCDEGAVLVVVVAAGERRVIDDMIAQRARLLLQPESKLRKPHQQQKGKKRKRQEGFNLRGAAAARKHY